MGKNCRGDNVTSSIVMILTFCTYSNIDQQSVNNQYCDAVRAAIEGIMKEKGRSFVNEHEVLHEVKQELTDYEEDLGKNQ